MRLTNYTDYSMTVLIYLGIHQGQLSTAQEISEHYDISRNHLSKIVHQLSKLGYIDSFKGAGGGIKLARDPSKINLGELVKKTEPDFNLVECFNPETDNCRISSVCKLKIILEESSRAFLENMGQYSLADILKNKRALKRVISGSSFD